MIRRLAVMLALATGCAGPIARGDFIRQGSWVDYNGTEPYPREHVKIAIEEVIKYGERKCGLKPAIWCLYAEMHKDPFQCGGVEAAGCYSMPGVCIVHVWRKPDVDVTHSALIHEGLHHVFNLCGDGSDGGYNGGPHSEQFLADVEALKEAARIRILLGE